ncbi:MAG TPA: tRNA preQ1(34) S-adenosylmethionine ribosyltransferase-isomerase QueA [Vicinamibacteria bacterium]
MKIDAFDYDLPPEAIAQEPLPERDASRLLVLDRAGGPDQHRVFHELPDLLDPGDLLVVNRTRVFPARLLGRRAGGGAAEVLLLRELDGAGLWEAFVRPGRRLRAGHTVEIADGFRVRVVGEAVPPDGRRRVALEAEGQGVAAALERFGHVPLPPYVRRADEPRDRERYQTIYARESGSVAAPTAGLHFTPALRERLAQRGIGWTEVLLHVGPGTFRPVAVDEIADHRVAAEPFEVPPDAAAAVAQARRRGGRVVAVGTTSVRALEAAAAPDRRVEARRGETELVIAPGYRFAVVDALITNFHLPRSSLLLLVAGLAGRERILDAYAEALRRGYRFYSYGDAMLIV